MDKPAQELKIRDVFFLFGKAITLGRHDCRFADVYRLAKIRVDTRRDKPIYDRPGHLSHIEHTHTFSYDLVICLNSGNQIKIARIDHQFPPDVITPLSIEGWVTANVADERRARYESPIDSYVLLESILQDMIGLPDIH